MNCPPIFYVRDDAGVPFATVVTNGDGDFGVSVCSSKDRFVKKKGRMIATGRSWDEKTKNCLDAPFTDYQIRWISEVGWSTRAI